MMKTTENKRETIRTVGCLIEIDPAWSDEFIMAVVLEDVKRSNELRGVSARQAKANITRARKAAQKWLDTSPNSPYAN